jgi:hypothetical protein
MSCLLTTSSELICPHGGTVTAISCNTRAKAGDFLVRASLHEQDPFINPPSTWTPGP